MITLREKKLYNGEINYVAHSCSKLITKLKLITKTTNDVNLTIFYKFEVPSNKGIYTILEIMSERNKNFGRKDFSVFVEIK